MIAKSSYDASSSILLEKLHWDNMLLRRKKHKSILMYKTINKLTPEYLQNLFSFRSTSYNLRFKKCWNEADFTETTYGLFEA
jgi:hypothetical protein